MKNQRYTNVAKDNRWLGCNIWMICLKLNRFFYGLSRMLHLSEFVWALRSSVCDVFINFLLIDATDRSKISSDQKRFFIALSLSPFHFSRTLPLLIIFMLWSKHKPDLTYRNLSLNCQRSYKEIVLKSGIRKSDLVARIQFLCYTRNILSILVYLHTVMCPVPVFKKVTNNKLFWLKFGRRRYSLLIYIYIGFSTKDETVKTTWNSWNMTTSRSN